MKFVGKKYVTNWERKLSGYTDGDVEGTERAWKAECCKTKNERKIQHKDKTVTKKGVKENRFKIKWDRIQNHLDDTILKNCFGSGQELKKMLPIVNTIFKNEWNSS